MLLIKDGNKYIAITTFAEKDIPKSAGFRWDKDIKKWWTSDADKAVKLAQYGNDEVRRELQRAVEAKREALDLSRATNAKVDLPVPDKIHPATGIQLEYLNYQKAGILYSMDRDGVLIGDEMGLGKTVQGIGIANCMMAGVSTDCLTPVREPRPLRILIIVPASMRLNWEREANLWLLLPLKVGVAVSDYYPDDADVVIINYDIVGRHRDKIDATDWDLLIVDEAHYLKNSKAQRTMHVLGGKHVKKEKQPDGSFKQHATIWNPIKAKRRVFMTGTPILNRPKEIFTICRSLDPDEFGSYYRFAYRYCAGMQTRFGFDDNGASNLDELQEKLRTRFMVRRLKKDVLHDLPAKRRQVIELPKNGAAKEVDNERRVMQQAMDQLRPMRVAVELAKASENPQDYRDAVERLQKATSHAFNEIAAARRDTAIAKVPYVIEHLENVSDKVVVFAHHKEVISRLKAALGDAAVVVTGDTPMQARQAAVDRFQTDPTCQFFLGNIKAAGVGLTLTAASHVVFAELTYTPGDIQQAEDRCHRIGQRESVLVQHLVLEESIDANMARALVEKQGVIEAALDDTVEVADLPDAVEPVLPEPPTTQKTTRKQVDEEAPTLTDAQIEAIHRGLRLLADLDPDRAGVMNGVGYNRLDGDIGHSLARSPRLTPRQAAVGRKLVNKYRRQLPTELVAQAMGVGA